MDDAAADDERLGRVGPGRAAPGVGDALRHAIDFIVGDNDLRVEQRRAAEHRIAETQCSCRVINVVIDMAGQGPGFDDAFRTKAVADFDGDALAVGQDVARAKLIGAAEAVALNFLAAVAVRRVGGKGSRGELFAAILRLHAVEAADVARQLRLDHARVEVAEQRIELRPFEADIEFAHRGRVVAAFATVGIDRVIGLRVDDAAKTGLVSVLVAVISHRQQPFALYAALGIKRDAPVGQPMLAVGTDPFQTTFQRIEADGPGGETDDSPRTVAGFEPAVDALRSRHLTVAEREGDRQRA